MIYPQIWTQKFIVNNDDTSLAKHDNGMNAKPKVGAVLMYLATNLEDPKKMNKIVKHIQHVNNHIQDQVKLIHVVFDFKNKSLGYAKHWIVHNEGVIKNFTTLVKDIKTKVQFEFVDMQSDFGRYMSTEIFNCTEISTHNKICDVSLMFKNSMSYFWGLQRLRQEGFELAFHIDDDWVMLNKTQGAENFVEFSSGILRHNPNILSVHLYNDDGFNNRFDCRFNGSGCFCHQYRKTEFLPHYNSHIQFHVQKSHVLDTPDKTPICGELIFFTCNVFVLNISKWFQNVPFQFALKSGVEGLIHKNIVNDSNVPLTVAFNYSGYVKIPFWG